MEVCRCRFHFWSTANKWKLSFTVSSVFHVCVREGCVCIFIYFYIFIVICCRFKRLIEAQAISLICLPFAYCANWGFSFVR
jgi:hypothetical protein